MTQQQLVQIGDIERMATSIAKSGLFGLNTIEQAVAMMLVAQAEGRHPAMAARDYHIIKGKPCLKADAMLARFQEAGGRVQFHEYTNERCEATFSHPSGGSLRLGWTIQDALKAGLTGKDVWKAFPRAMLRARVISEGIRSIYPGVICGVYTAEEVAESENEPIAMGTACVVVSEPAPAARTALAAVPTATTEPMAHGTADHQGMDPKTAAFIGKVLGRAKQLGNFADAEALLRTRLEGNPQAIDFAMSQLALASDQARGMGADRAPDQRAEDAATQQQAA